MRLTDFRTLTEQQLDELRMNPGALRDFANSPAAEGIRAGFEAELVFTGLGGAGDDEYDMEPDMDMDERCKSIDEVIDFFSNDDWGYGLSPRGERELRNGLDERYMEWSDERMIDAFRDEAVELIKQVIENEEWDWEDKTREALEAMGLDDEEIDAAIEAGESAPRYTKLSDQEAAKEANKAYENYLEGRDQAENDLQTQAENSFEDQDGFYDMALDEFRNDFYVDDDRDFFNDIGLRWMSDVRDEFDLDWPYMTGTGSDESGYNEYNAQQLADDLSEVLGVKTKVSSGYHSAKRDDVTWIFEPDSSLDADSGDMPVEIISPPMPLTQCLQFMSDFFKWAKRNDAYANRSTGFHMGVSMPYGGGDVDFVKLALFLGDEHVLQEFGRQGNHFTEAAMKKIRQRVTGNADVAGALELMKHNLLELASRSIQKGGFGKYTSINPNNKYIEFRSAGGDDYFEDLDKLQNTLMRYAQAMFVASRPDLERKEYYKKLYKLISPAKGDPAIDLFARYTSGTISKEELKAQWAEAILNRDAPELVQKGDWVVINQSTGQMVRGQEYRGFTQAEARNRAKQSLSPASSDTDFNMSYDVVPMFTGKWEIYAKDEQDNESTLEIVNAENRGGAVDQVYDKYSQQGINFYARPYYGDGKAEQPEPKLTRRAELAKRIKQGPKGQQRTPHGVPEWELYDISTNNVINSMVAHDINDAWQQADDWLRSIGAEDRSTYKQRFAIRPMMVSGVRDIPITVDQDTGPRLSYELYQHDTPDTVFHRMPNATADEVRAFINQQEQEGMPPGFLRVRLA